MRLTKLFNLSIFLGAILSCSKLGEDFLITDKEISSFSIDGKKGLINGNEINIQLPESTDITLLSPRIEIKGEIISPGSGLIQNFSEPRIYTVTAKDGTTKTYIVTVSLETNSALGDTGPAGGVIFYDKGNSVDAWRYLEAAPSDAPLMLIWQEPKELIGTTGFAIGAGKTNSESVAQFLRTDSQTVSRAIIFCDSYSIGGFSDWFLPSKFELDLMYLNKASIGGFEGNKYWSSSEDSSDTAWYQLFNSGSRELTDKVNLLSVRCVRSY